MVSMQTLMGVWYPQHNNKVLPTCILTAKQTVLMMCGLGLLLVI